MLKFTSLLKDVIKNTDEWPDEEIHRARSGRVPNHLGIYEGFRSPMSGTIKDKDKNKR